MRIDFYILNGCNEKNNLHYACRLLNKIYHAQKNVLVYIDDKIIAQTFDELLWTFNDISFVPHTLGKGTLQNAPIIITEQLDFVGQYPIILNLSEQALPDIKNFERIIELVPNVEPQKSYGRKKYLTYKNKQYQLKTHEIN